MPNPRYDIYCSVNRDKICNAKVELLQEFTGDPTGVADIEGPEISAHLLNTALRDRDSRATDACLDDSTMECPVQDAVNRDRKRKIFAGPARTLLKRLVR